MTILRKLSEIPGLEEFLTKLEESYGTQIKDSLKNSELKLKYENGGADNTIFKYTLENNGALIEATKGYIYGFEFNGKVEHCWLMSSTFYIPLDDNFFKLRVKLNNPVINNNNPD